MNLEKKVEERSNNANALSETCHLLEKELSQQECIKLSNLKAGMHLLAQKLGITQCDVGAFTYAISIHFIEENLLQELSEKEIDYFCNTSIKHALGDYGKDDNNYFIVKTKTLKTD